MFTCGACADEIVVQEGIRHPGHACKSPLHAPLQYLHLHLRAWVLADEPAEDGQAQHDGQRAAAHPDQCILMAVCSLGKDAGWDDPTKIPVEDII